MDLVGPGSMSFLCVNRVLPGYLPGVCAFCTHGLICRLSAVCLDMPRPFKSFDEKVDRPSFALLPVYFLL